MVDTMDVEQIRKTAQMRMEIHCLGMVLTCRQVLALIERGDARVKAYEARIAKLEERIAELEDEVQMAVETAVREGW